MLVTIPNPSYPLSSFFKTLLASGTVAAVTACSSASRAEAWAAAVWRTVASASLNMPASASDNTLKELVVGSLKRSAKGKGKGEV